MSEGILKFNLLEENNEFKLAQNGSKLHSLLRDVDAELRTKLKHGDPEKDPAAFMEDLRKVINEGLYELGLGEL